MRAPRGLVVGSVVLVGVVAMAGAACGHSSSVSLSVGAGRTPAIADRAVAERAVLQTGDLPGFEVATPLPADAASQQAASSFEACAGTAAALGDDDRVALSPAFVKAKTTLVSSVAVVAADEAQARRAMSDLSRSDLSGCVTGLFRSVLSLDQMPGTTAKTEPVEAARAGDQAATWRTTIQVTAGNQTVAAYSDITFLRSGRTVAALFDFQVGEPFAAGERARLVKALVARMGAA